MVREKGDAAGPYPYQHPGGDGLPRWTRADRSLENEDVVLWYTLGITHVARPEEWPVMPTGRPGCAWSPTGSSPATRHSTLGVRGQESGVRKTAFGPLTWRESLPWWSNSSGMVPRGRPPTRPRRSRSA